MNSTTEARLRPYRCSPVFDERSMPQALLREHRTKAGVWGLVRVLEGSVMLHVVEPESVRVLDAEHPAVVLPEQEHFVELIGGRMRLQIEFYDALPDAAALASTPTHDEQ